MVCCTEVSERPVSEAVWAFAYLNIFSSGFISSICLKVIKHWCLEVKGGK